MTVTICVSNYFNEKEYYIIDKKSIQKRLQKPPRNKLLKCRLKTEANGIDVYYFIREIVHYSNYREKLNENPIVKEKFLLIKIVPPQREVIDYKWNHITSNTLWEKIEVDYLMSWLSTLGGGFSALGEQFSRCAETAGKISLRQLQLGLQLGDPFLQARCKLYYSISLIQTGRLRAAKHLIREQYNFAITQATMDTRLLNMCLGIWHRLQYEYMLRQQRKLTNSMNPIVNFCINLTAMTSTKIESREGTQQHH